MADDGVDVKIGTVHAIETSNNVVSNGSVRKSLSVVSSNTS